MSSVVISGDTSGSITVTAPAVAGTYTQTLPQITGTLGTLNSGTAVASTSGTSIDFTSIPANVRRITVMFVGVSTSGTSNIQIQIGSGSVTTTGYVSGSWTNNTSTANATTGMLVTAVVASSTNMSGVSTLATLGSNTWAYNAITGGGSAGYNNMGSGYVAIGGALDRVRITTANGTDTFDAGSINILYE
jgi:hypothetical protein